MSLPDLSGAQLLGTFPRDDGPFRAGDLIITCPAPLDRGLRVTFAAQACTVTQVTYQFSFEQGVQTCAHLRPDPTPTR